MRSTARRRRAPTEDRRCPSKAARHSSRMRGPAIDRRSPLPGSNRRLPEHELAPRHGSETARGHFDGAPTAYAEVALTNGPRIDARPSDALTLAVIAGVPICVARARARRRRVRPLGGG
ncbi:MAG: bifunctional nuclease family protein [Actinobacteria bacterium]|nr:MAG: bifunctional nuclease family protein [Actinomycetota bacterium]